MQNNTIKTASDNAEHTPLPWAATNCGSHIQIHREGWPRDAWSVANIDTQAQDAANGNLIVRAVNSHDKMIAALECLLETAPYDLDTDNDLVDYRKFVIRTARLALAKS